MFEPLLRYSVGDFRRAAPKGHVDKGRFVDPLVAFFHTVVHCQANFGHGRA